MDGDEYEAMEGRLLGEALASPFAAEAQVLALDAGLAGMNLDRHHPPPGLRHASIRWCRRTVRYG